MFGIITKSDNNTGSQQLAKNARALGYEACLVYAQKPDKALLLKCNHVIARATTETLIDVVRLTAMCEKYGISVSPGSQELLRAFNKCLTYNELVSHTIAQPLSVTFLPNQSINDIPFQPPYVIKPATGNRGIGVAKCTSLAALITTSKADIYQNNGFIVQEFIEAEGSDKRIFVIGNNVVAAMKRISVNDDFRSNIAIGGTAERYQWTKEEAILAVAATKSLGLDFAGVDIIDSPRGPLVLEVNPSPGFKVGEYANINIAKSIVEFLVDKSKENND